MIVDVHAVSIGRSIHHAERSANSRALDREGVSTDLASNI